MTPKARFVASAITLGIALTTLHASSQPISADTTAKEPTKEQKEEAGIRFRKGVELFKETDFQAALIEFRRAYELAPNYAVLYNIGQVYFQLLDYPNALASLERYVSEGGKAIPKSRREEVEKDIDKLKSRVATLDLTSPIADVDVLVDDVSIGRTPLPKPAVVSAGRHKITATKQGYQPFSKVIEIAGLDTLKLSLDLVEQKDTTVITPPPDTSGTVVAPPPSASVGPITTPPIKVEQPSVPWGAWVLTGGLAVGAGIAGGLALSASSELVAARGKPATKDDLANMASDVSTKALVSDILMGAAAVSGVVSIVLTVRAMGGGSASSDSGAPAPGAAPTTSGIQNLKFGVGPGSVAVSGSF